MSPDCPTADACVDGAPPEAADAPWYASWFNRKEYELVYRNRDEREAEALIDLIVRAVRPAPGARVLDMACGRGRHALALARRGCRVTGIDLSPVAIATARRLAAEAGAAAAFRVGDMRAPVCEGCFDGAVNLFTAFGYFTDPAENLRALHVIAQAVQPGGWFVQDFLNAPYVAATLRPLDVRREAGFEVEQRRWIAEGRVNKRITLRREGREQTFTESVSLIARADFERMYGEVGLEIAQVYGDYGGSAWSEASPRLILCARRQGRS